MVTVSLWLGCNYYFGLALRGAPLGSDLCDIQCGTPALQNTLKLPGPQKYVLQAPFRKLIDPCTVRLRRIAEFAQKMVAFDNTGSPRQAARVVWSSIRC